MARIDLPQARLTDYERAVCYYTLPKVTYPVTFGLIVAYAVCVIEALALLAYGAATQNYAMARLGAFAVFGIVIFGVVAFMIRAFLNEIRERRALAIARGVPDAVANGADIPDPFADHMLLRHPLHTRGDLFPCTDNDGTLAYFVESSPSSPWWKVKDAYDSEVIRVHVDARASSFTLSGLSPACLSVYVGATEVAKIRRRFSIGASRVTIDCFEPATRRYTFANGGIHREKRLVGRIYYMHQSLYLDLDRSEFHEGILGLFITMT